MASILPFPDRGYSSSIILGTTPAGNPIRVTQNELCSGCYILGLQRSGKSSLLEQIIYEQMKQDECIIVFDPKGGDLIRNVIARMPANKLGKTYLLDVTDTEHPFSFNPFACQDPGSEAKRQITKNSVMRACTRLWLDVTTQHYFRLLLPHVTEVLIEFPELTIMQVNKFLRDKNFRAPYVQRQRDWDTQEFWLEEFSTWDHTNNATAYRWQHG